MTEQLQALTGTAGGTPPVATRRTTWWAARARNAARRGWLVAAAGLMAVIGTVTVLTVLPHEVDRALRDRISALPPITDTLPLLATLEAARQWQQQADSNLRALRTADADRVAVAVTKSTATDDAVLVGGTGLSTDAEARRELGIRVTRARAAPLIESYRAVGEAELLRADARVRALMDSLNDVNTDREAYAALGGADARYAALTARITTLGQRLVAMAEQRLAAGATPGATQSAPSPVASPTPPPTSVAPASASPPAAVSDSVQHGDTTTLAPRARFNVDSVADRQAQAALDSATAQFVRAGQTLEQTRQANTEIIKQADATRARLTVRVPAVAMLLAALVTGVFVGYAVALFVEVRQPRVADVGEVERLTGTRVIVHTGASPAALNMRYRRRADSVVPEVIDMAADSYQLLHVTLTGFGDTTRAVRVVGDAPLVTATVGINLAAAAARESRATMLIDGDIHARVAGPLLRQVNQPGIAEALASPASLPSRVMRVGVGREHHLDALLAGSGAIPSAEAPAASDRDAETNAAKLGTSLSGKVVVAANDARNSAFHAELDALLQQEDFVVVLGPSEDLPDVLPDVDVILCARLGLTRLNWLARTVAQLREHDVRLRSVLLWTTAAPSKP